VLSEPVNAAAEKLVNSQFPNTALWELEVGSWELGVADDALYGRTPDATLSVAGAGAVAGTFKPRDCIN
jgi:hypothetical protein